MFKQFMKVLTIFSFFLLGFFFLATSLKANDICPENLTLDQCYDHLNKKAKDLEARSKELSQNISQEKYNQMSLEQQIEYMTAKINETEIEIQRIEVDLETKNVEIRILQRDIGETSNHIATLSQETNRLQNSISKRVSIAYKYSFLNPLELILKTHNIDEMLRNLKFLNEARRNDRAILQDLMDKNNLFSSEQEKLERDQLSLERKRIEVEDKKSQLFNEKQNLASQQATHSSLLTQSKQRESSYQQSLSKIEEAQNQVTEQLAEITRQMYERGDIPLNRKVKKGEIIGYQGYSGFTYGAHLHLVVYNENGTPISPFSGGLLSGGAWLGGVGAGIYGQPLAGGVLTQGFHVGHRAIDLQSRTHGIQSGAQYYGHEIRCYGMVRWAGYYNMRGTGAPIYAIADGYVSGMQTYPCCGGKYVYLKHDDGRASLYLHLQ
jgi:peptidoglycan hydrolase CwlO-like protein